MREGTERERQMGRMTREIKRREIMRNRLEGQTHRGRQEKKGTCV